MKPALSISINEIHLKINTICQIIKKQFSKAPVKGREEKVNIVNYKCTCYFSVLNVSSEI